jgi:hypothetical protein
MSYVLIVAAFEFGNPMMLFVLVKAHDALIHCKRAHPRRREAKLKPWAELA